jgi:hypothetical protein
MKTAKSRILEAHVQQAVVEYLQLDRWRAFRTELTVQRERGRVVGERGQPDYLFVRYSHPCRGAGCSGEHCGTIDCVECELLWIEFKRPGEKPRADQIAWHQAERKRGALVLVVDSFDDFAKLYETSGLQRMVSARRTG